jgi:hypothetical protein
MEYVSDDKLLTIPLSVENPEKRPLPSLEIEENEKQLQVSVVYREADSIRHLRNILHSSQNESQASFNTAMRLVPVNIETRLWKKGFKETNYVLQKKYIASRLDDEMLSRLLDEVDVIRSGGRRTYSGRSVYEAPATPILQLLFAKIRPEEDDLKRILFDMKPIISILSNIKTQRELIHSNMTKPVDVKVKYREFIMLLNKARSEDFISADDRRGLDKKWREVPEERSPIEEDLKRRIGST